MLIYFGGGLSNVYFCKIMFTPKDLTHTNIHCVMLHILLYVTYDKLCYMLCYICFVMLHMLHMLRYICYVFNIRNIRTYVTYVA